MFVPSFLSSQNFITFSFSHNRRTERNGECITNNSNWIDILVNFNFHFISVNIFFSFVVVLFLFLFIFSFQIFTFDYSWENKYLVFYHLWRALMFDSWGDWYDMLSVVNKVQLVWHIRGRYMRNKQRTNDITAFISPRSKYEIKSWKAIFVLTRFWPQLSLLKN